MRGRLIATASGCVKRLRAARPPRIIAALDRGGAMPALVTSRREGSLLYVALNRPEKRNAIQRELLLALVDAIAAAEREPDVRAVVVYGEGPVFSAGVDFGMLTGDVAGTSRLGRTVGYARAKELVMTSRMIGAAEALAIGLVNQVVPPGEHVAAAARLAEEIAANAPLAVGLAKRLIDLGSNVDKHTFLALELLAQSVLLRSEDAREGARALAERRPPRFTGR